MPRGLLWAVYLLSRLGLDGFASCVSLVSQPGVVNWERFVTVEALLMGTRGAGRAVCVHP